MQILHRSKKSLVLLLVVAVVLLAFGLWFRRFMQVDACLDSGGRWNYDSNICER
jgi:hypothetical protein